MNPVPEKLIFVAMRRLPIVATMVSFWLVTSSAFAQFTLTSVPGLPGFFAGALAWGDFDNDSRPDFLVAGTIDGGNVSQLWRNTSPASNSPPAAPAALSATVSGTTAVLEWNAPADDHTLAAGLSYNLRVGTTAGGSDIVSAPALSNGVLRLPQMGAVRKTSVTLHQLTPGRTYYWSVQAVDTGFAGSPFAHEQHFSIRPLLTNPLRHANGVFEFSFTAAPGTPFTVVTTTNMSSALTNWTILGSPNEISPGMYHFADPQASTGAQRYYGVSVP